MQDLIKEIAEFSTACLSGVVIYIAYQILYLFRKAVPHSVTCVDAEDLAFWILTACYLFYQMYVTMAGRIRWHFVLGTVIGAGLAKFAFFCGKSIYIKIQKRIEKKSKKR